MISTLDDLSNIRKLDQQGMLGVLGKFDKQLEEALGIALEAGLPDTTSPIESLLICGMGGSAIGGDILRVYLGSELTIPLAVNRGYSIPSFADSSTLAFICSYSGNTEETLSAFQQAEESNCRIVCVTSGGRLKKLSEKGGHQCLLIPGELPPRTALGYIMVPMLGVLFRLGLVPDTFEELKKSFYWLRQRVLLYGETTETQSNPAKQLALRVHGKVPVIYGSESRLDAVAVRWRSQFSENGKQLAYSSSLPEMNHNEIVGWKHPAQALRAFLPIFLWDREDDPHIQIRSKLTRQLIEEKTGASLGYSGEGGSWWERLWTLILLGDYASVYLGLLNQEDPTPVDIIETLKKRVKKLKGTINNQKPSQE